MGSSPASSPDGRKIAALRAVEIWVMNADGSSRRRVGIAGATSVDWQRCVARGPAAFPVGLGGVFEFRRADRV